jgi:hypothetical protein
MIALNIETAPTITSSSLQLSYRQEGKGNLILSSTVTLIRESIIYSNYMIGPCDRGKQLEGQGHNTMGQVALVEWIYGQGGRN